LTVVKPADVRRLFPGPVRSALSARTQVRILGRLLHGLSPLIKQGGAVARDVMTVEYGIWGGLKSQRDIARTRAALARLYDSAQLLPRAEAEFVQRALIEKYWRVTLADRNVAATFADGLDEFRKASRRTVFRGLDFAAARAERKVLGEAHKVMLIAQKILKAQGTDPELVKLLAHVFSVVPPDSPFFLNAAKVALDNGQAIWTVMKRKSMPVAARRQAIIGHFVNIRGPIGEGYAILDDAVSAGRAATFEEMQREALQLGKGHVPLDLNQVQHGLSFADGQPGPDAMQIIHDVRGNRGITKELFQVKIARPGESEGAKQTVGDAFRKVGLFKTGAMETPVLIFKLPGQVDEVRLPLTTDPRVRPRPVIVNALDSTMPLRDRLELDLLGLPVDEWRLNLTVAQFNHATVPVLEAALVYLQKAGKLK
jgi:hypothetical protein